MDEDTFIGVCNVCGEEIESYEEYELFGGSKGEIIFVHKDCLDDETK